MNCEKYQSLISDFIDGSLSPEDYQSVESHLGLCADCAEVRGDLGTIVTYCQDHRGEYEASPNERALWLRISNLIDAELPASSVAAVPANAGWWFRLMNRSWQLSFPQLAASVIAVAILVSLVTIAATGRFDFRNSAGISSSGISTASNHSPVADRYRQQQQTIDYWNQRVELNKARWNPQMRETFERNLNVIDTAVNDSMRQLNQNPHDEVSEEILNAALNDKVELLKEFAEL
jgi:anti-sigma factor RsiW